jgi:hypothetical protein
VEWYAFFIKKALLLNLYYPALYPHYLLHNYYFTTYYNSYAIPLLPKMTSRGFTVRRKVFIKGLIKFKPLQYM